MFKVINVNIGREDLFRLLKKNNNTGVELGVAHGEYSLSAIKSKKFKHFFGIDSYDLGKYSSKEYKIALKKINLFKYNNYKLLRMRFEEALDLFADNSLDFIYFDGFAHNGQLGGKTIVDWFKKIKVGGIIAGDDYHNNWPLVIEVVNDISEQLNTNLYITKIIKKSSYSEFPSWYLIKPKNSVIKINNKILQKSILRNRFEFVFIFLAMINTLVVSFLKKILPKKIIKILKNRK